jgi:hypothetical protein
MAATCRPGPHHAQAITRLTRPCRPFARPSCAARGALQRLELAETAAAAGAARAAALQREASGAAERARGLEDQLLCSICMDRPRDSVLLPCCHFVACSVCVGQIMSDAGGGSGGGAAAGSGGGAARAGSGSDGGSARRCPVCRGCIHGQVVVHLAAAAAADAAGPPQPAQEPPDAAPAAATGAE